MFVLDFSGQEFYLKVLGWRTNAGAEDWVDSWRAAELWAQNCVSTETTRDSVTPEPVQTTADLWRMWTPWFSFDVPEPWRGRVKARFASESSVVVFPNELPQYNLVSVSMGSASNRYPGGDIGAGLLWGIDNGRGLYVYLIGVNAYFNYRSNLERDRAQGVSVDLEREIVDLQTGGAHSLEDFAVDGSDFTAETAFSYYEQAVAPTIEVAMDDNRALLAGLMRSGYGDLTVAAFHKRVHNAFDLGEGLDWVLELGEREDVRAWAANYMPVAYFATQTLPPFLTGAFELSATVDPVDPAFWRDEGQLVIDFELAYEIDPLVARVGDLQQIGWHQGALSKIPHLAGGGKNPTDAQEARAAIEEQVAWQMGRYEHPGITFDLHWTYTLPDGTQVEGSHSC